MKTHSPLNPKSRTDLGRISGKNPLKRDRLISSAYKTAKSVTKTRSKVQEFKTYD